MIFALIISIIYILLISAFIIGFDKVKFVENKNITPKNTFSILIPFRNEAHNLPSLLNSISLLNYPTNLFEILLVNDESEDNFNQIIEAFKAQYPNLNLLLIENNRKTNSPKKDAIQTAIKFSKHNWIVTTDADCEVPKNWLLIFNQFIETDKPLFMSAPVIFKQQKGFLFNFQNLNFISLIGSTIGCFGIKKPIMCNGANLCYHKNTFTQLNGFEENTTIASGDDIFLMEKYYNSFPEKIHFLKSQESIVFTNSEPSWKLFLHQQLRWASKSTSYTNDFSKIVATTIILKNFLILLLALLSIINPIFWKYFFSLFMLKMIVDFTLISKTAHFLKVKNAFAIYFLISLIYPLFITLIGGLSFFKKYKWKGRTFNK